MSAVHLKWISTTLVKALNTVTPSLVVEPRIYFTGKDYPIPEVPEILQDRASVSSSEDKNDALAAYLPSYSALKLTHGRPSIKKLLNEEIASSLGPVSVDGTLLSLYKYSTENFLTLL